MAFDALVTNPGRLRILTALAVEDHVEFVRLRRLTQLSDGNLSCHARRLASAGLVAINKAFRDGKPVTRLMLTSDGRAALEGHVRRLMAALSHRRLGPIPTDDTPSEPPGGAPRGRRHAQQESVEPVGVAPVSPAELEPLVDDWVD
jgi:DNA-binding MarR family transcriptional regulator